MRARGSHEGVVSHAAQSGADLRQKRRLSNRFETGGGVASVAEVVNPPFLKFCFHFCTCIAAVFTRSFGDVDHRQVFLNRADLGT